MCVVVICVCCDDVALLLSSAKLLSLKLSFAGALCLFRAFQGFLHGEEGEAGIFVHSVLAQVGSPTASVAAAEQLTDLGDRLQVP